MHEAVQVAIGIIVRDGSVLVTGRADDDRFAGKWEFPGGKLEPTESAVDALHRELDEELGINIAILARLAPITHDYNDFRVVLHPFVVQICSGTPQAKAARKMQWFPASELAELPFPEANRDILNSLPSVLRTLGLKAV